MVTLAEVNEQLDTVTFVEVTTDHFRVEGHIPSWTLDFCPQLRETEQICLADYFVFLGGFIEQAYEDRDNEVFSRIGSGPWTERDINDVEKNLSALAVFVKNQLVIQVSVIPDELRYHQRIFQKAREYSLEFEQSKRDKQQREVLLHAIVHDLSMPLTTIDGVLHLLGDPKLSVDEKSRLRSLMESQIASAQGMVRSILEIFLWEHKFFRASDLTEDDAPVAITSVQAVIANFEPTFKQESVDLVFGSNLQDTGQKIMAEEDQLQRVLSNLLENALRFSPRGSTVTVMVEEGPLAPSKAESITKLIAKPIAKKEFEVGQLTITVSDQGPGVPAELAETLFQRFVGGSEYGGRVGLGLHYCHICLQRWGGQISYIAPSLERVINESTSGACFRMLLPKFPAPEMVASASLPSTD